MRIARLSILIGLVLVSFGMLLLAGNYYVPSLSCLSRLDAGEPGTVARMLDAGMADTLERYHLGHIKNCAVNLPDAPAYAAAAAHPRAERFFYVDAGGSVTIKGLSDENVPPDYSQKCILFADSALTWFKLRLLLEAFINERIRYIYLAGLAPDGRLSYTPLEITVPGAFPMLYPHRVCMLRDDAACYYYEDEEILTPYSDLESFKKTAEKVREQSVASRPFMRLLAMDRVSVGAVHRILTMFEPAGVQPLVKLRSEDREYILAAVAELLQEEKEPDEEEE